MLHVTRLLAAILLVLLPMGIAGADNYFPTNPYQARFCAGLETHFRPENAWRVDCVSSTNAIVVEYQDYWREAVGQALVLATERGLKPGIVLVCRNDEGHCIKASERIEATFAHFAVPLTLWECMVISPALGDCVRRECGPGGCV
ncbi:MAG TPA: hypothetical protein VG757_15270 [Devosia sp.]|nr:hypothetical protein [Devosia sp.]